MYRLCPGDNASSVMLCGTQETGKSGTETLQSSSVISPTEERQMHKLNVLLQRKNIIRLISDRGTPNGQTQRPTTKEIHYPSYLRARNAKCTNSTSCYKENTLSVLSQTEERQMHKLNVLLQRKYIIRLISDRGTPNAKTPSSATFYRDNTLSLSISATCYRDNTLSILFPTEEHQMHKCYRDNTLSNLCPTEEHQMHKCYRDNTLSNLFPTEEHQMHKLQSSVTKIIHPNLISDRGTLKLMHTFQVLPQTQYTNLEQSYFWMRRMHKTATKTKYRQFYLLLTALSDIAPSHYSPKRVSGVAG